MLRKRFDGLEWLFPASSLPVGVQLVPMEESPLGYERACSGRQRPGDHHAIQID
jgi:hypothetical protein